MQYNIKIFPLRFVPLAFSLRKPFISVCSQKYSLPLFLFQSTNIHIWVFNLSMKGGWNSCTLLSFVYEPLNCSVMHSIVGPFPLTCNDPSHTCFFFFSCLGFPSISLAYFLFFWTNTTFSSSSYNFICFHTCTSS